MPMTGLKRRWCRETFLILVLPGCINMSYRHGDVGPGDEAGGSGGDVSAGDIAGDSFGGSGDDSEPGDAEPGELVWAEWPLPYTGAEVTAIWGFARDDVYAGVGNRLLHSSGGDWSVLGTTPHQLSIRALSGYEGLVFVGTEGGFYTFDGTAFYSYGSGAVSDIIAFGRTEVFVTTNVTMPTRIGALELFDGSDMAEVFSRPGMDFNSVWGASASELFVVGTTATVLHWDGQVHEETVEWNDAWGARPLLSFHQVRGVGSRILAIGTGYMIFERDAGTWRASATPQSQTSALYDLAGWGDTIYVVGYPKSGQPAMLKRDTSSWLAVELPDPMVRFKAAWSGAEGHIVVGGDDGSIPAQMLLGTEP